MAKKEWITEPCRRCGKTPRYDFDGYCMDCAEDLALRGLYAPMPDRGSYETETEADPRSTADEKAS